MSYVILQLTGVNRFFSVQQFYAGFSGLLLVKSGNCGVFRRIFATKLSFLKHLDDTMGVARIFSGGGNTFSKKISKNSQKIFKKFSKNIPKNSKKFKKFQKILKNIRKILKDFHKNFQKNFGKI